MTAKKFLISIGSILSLILTASSYAEKKNPPIKQAPHHSPMPQQAPVHIPAQQAPAQQAPAQVIEQPHRLKSLPPKAPIDSPVPHAPRHVPSQGPSSLTPKAHHLRGQHLKLNVEPSLLPGLPSFRFKYSTRPSSKFDSPRKKYGTPGAFSSYRTWAPYPGIFPSIRNQRGEIFKPWIPHPSMNIGARTVGTSTAPKRFFSRQGGRNFQHRDFFRHRFGHNFSLFFNSLPFLIIPYYPETYNIYYSEFYCLPYCLESTAFYSPEYTESYYPEYTESYYSEYTEFYPQDGREKPESEISLEAQELEELIKSVLQEIKIFDIPAFYNRPELSILHPSSQS